MKKKKIAIFASGSGTNAERIMSHFKDHARGEVALVCSNKPDAKVLQRAEKFHVPVHVFDRTGFYDSTEILQVLQERETVTAPVTPATQFMMDEIERQRERVVLRRASPEEVLKEIQQKVNAQLARVRELNRGSAS